MRIHHATTAKAKKFGITLTVEENEVVATKAGVRLASGLQGNKVLEDAITKATGKPAKSKSERKAAAPAVVDAYETACRDAGWRKTRWGFKNDEGDETEATTWQELAEEFELIEPHSEEEAEADMEDGEEATGGRSIVKSKYKQLYKPHKDKSGDDLSFQINKHVSREDDAGDMKINLDALRKFAKANGCWQEGYTNLKSRTGGWNAGMARMNVANRLRAKIRQAKKAEEEFEIKWA